MAASGAPWTRAGLRGLVEAAGPVPVHMDGARLFNAEAATGVPAAEWAAPVTTVMCCLSKGLCAPVGSLLAGAEDVIAEGRLARKRLGGGMRQAGVLAAPGLVALSEMVARLPEDHARAARLADAVAQRWPRLRARSGHRAHQHRDVRARPTPTSCWRTWRATGCWPMPSRRGRSASSRTTTSTTTGSTVPSPLWPTRRETMPGEGPDRDQRGRREPRPRRHGRAGAGDRATPASTRCGCPRCCHAPGPTRSSGWPGSSGACPGLKIGTTMLLPGRNLVWLAKAVGTLDVLSGGRFLLTFVPGLGIGGERSAIGIPTADACRADGRRAARAAAAVGGRGGQPRRAGGFLHRRLGLAATGPGPLRRLARAATSRPRWSAVGGWPTGGSPPSARPVTPPPARR